MVESSRAKLNAEIHTVLDGTAILMRWIELINQSDESMALSNLTVMGGGLETVLKWREFVDEDEFEKMYSVGFFEHDQWGAEGSFRWHDLGAARMTVQGHFPIRRHRHPMFMLKNNHSGAIFFGQLGYSDG